MTSIATILLLSACGSTFQTADTPPGAAPKDARGVVEGWVAAALAGKLDEAGPLADPNTSLSKEKGVNEFRTLLGVAKLRIPTVYASEKQGRAVAVSEPVKLTKANPDGQDQGVMSFKLVRAKGRWGLKDVDFDSAEEAKQKIAQFREKYADAKELPPASREQ